MVVVAVLVPAGCAVVVLLARQLGLPASTALVAAAAAWRVGLWLAVAVAAGRSRAGGEPWLVVVLALLTLTALADAVAVFVPQPAGAVAAGLAAATGAAAVLGASRDVRECLLAQSQDLHRLSLDVSDSRRREQWAQAEHEERLHDVRSVLAGIHGATATLQRYEDRLDPGVRRRLEQAVTAELHRLEHLVDPSPVEGSVSDLDVEAVLEPVLLTERQQGAAIRADLRGVSVRADAADLATIVCALLVNARRHAAGSPVVVRAETRRGETQLRVEDAGPGVPLHLRESVFERGERGEATAPGSGLGLYTARRLATAAGGTLHVEPRSQGGASFVLTLPAGSLHAARPRVRQDGAQRDEVGDAVGVDGVTLPRQRDHGARPDVLLAPGADDGDVVADR
jgi:signal transduction histidine kinase